jgi:hypothetical protein
MSSVADDEDAAVPSEDDEGVDEQVGWRSVWTIFQKWVATKLAF